MKTEKKILIGILITVIAVAAPVVLVGIMLYGSFRSKPEVYDEIEYPSTDYIGYYGVKEESTYELLAVYADEYNGFDATSDNPYKTKMMKEKK